VLRETRPNRGAAEGRRARERERSRQTFVVGRSPFLSAKRCGSVVASTEMASPPPEQRAAHEAGHVVACILHLLRVDFVSIEPLEEDAGRTESSRPDPQVLTEWKGSGDPRFADYDIDRAMLYARISLAGRFGEQLLVGHLATNGRWAGADDRRARAYMALATRGGKVTDDALRNLRTETKSRLLRHIDMLRAVQTAILTAPLGGLPGPDLYAVLGISG
jgi:hypothetical protein